MEKDKQGAERYEDQTRESIVGCAPALIPDGNDGSGPPDGGYGWVCVASVFIINSFVWGVNSSYGVYLAHYLANDVFPEATSLDYAFIGGLNFGVAMAVASPVTYICRNLGTHVPMVIGCLVMAGGYIAASFASRIWQLYLTQGVLVGLGTGFLFVPSAAIPPQWFDKRRTLATGITSSGAGIGGIIFSFAIQAIIKNISLGWALRITGIVSGVMNLIATAFIRNRNKQIQPPMRAFDIKLIGRLNVFLLLSWGFFSMLGYMCLLYSLSDFGRSIGLSDSKAAAVTAILNAGSFIGRPCVGFLSDRYGRIEIAGLMTFVCCISVFAIWIPANSFGVLIFFAIVAGAVLGVFWMTITPLCVVVAGLKELPSLLSITWFVIILPTTFSEVIALKLRRPGTGHAYLYPQLFSGLAYLVGSILMLALWFVERPKTARP